MGALCQWLLWPYRQNGTEDNHDVDDEKDEKNENDEKYEKNEDLPNCSGISFNFLSQGLINRKESQKKGPQKRTLTPSSVRSERKTAEFEARDQFLRKLRPVNSPMESDGQRKRFGA